MEHTPTLSIKLSGQSRTSYYRHELSQISNQSDGFLVDDKMVDDKKGLESIISGQKVTKTW